MFGCLNSVDSHSLSFLFVNVDTVLQASMIWPQTQEQIFKEPKKCLGCFKSAQSDLDHYLLTHIEQYKQGVS